MPITILPETKVNFYSRETEHPHIIRREGICGGRPVIKGTRVPVQALIEYYKFGMAIQDILEGFPQIDPGQLHDAFSYYYDHQEEIEKDIALYNDEEAIR